MNHESPGTASSSQTFFYQLDFYWQAIAVYAVALLAYILLKGTVSANTLSFVFYDPLVILLLLFITGSGLGLLINWWAQRTIIVGQDFITFKNRVRERTYRLQDILRIHVGSDHEAKVRGKFKVIKIATRLKRRALRIRPGTYNDEKALTQAILRLKKNMPPRTR